MVHHYDHKQLGVNIDPKLVRSIENYFVSYNGSIFQVYCFPRTDFYHIHDEFIILNRENSLVTTNMKKMKRRLIRSFYLLHM